MVAQDNLQSGKIVSQATALRIVKKNVIKSDTNINYYISIKPLLPGTKIKTVDYPVISPDFTSWFIFIDDAPFMSWAHKCRYVFVDITTGKYVVQAQKLPPISGITEPVKELKMEERGKLFKFEAPKNICSTGNDYAVIISGGMDKDNNWVRYWNDCSAIYSALTNIYGFSDSHIYVLMADGTDPANDRRHYDGTYDSSPLDLDGDGDNDIQYAATKANITAVFNTLANILDGNDNLFIYTTDHGVQESGQDVKIILWGETMRDDEFAAEVDKVNAGRINITMIQCFSGGFIDDLQKSNRVITTSCRYNESANALPPDYIYTAFTYYWTAAVAGEYPDGTPVDADYNDDGWISMSEAFTYANGHDNTNETPQYSSTPSDLGSHLALHGLIPYISGPSTVCTSNATFTLHNRPAGATVKWGKSKFEPVYVSGQGTDHYTVKASSNEVKSSGFVRATITSSCGNFTFTGVRKRFIKISINLGKKKGADISHSYPLFKKYQYGQK